MTKISVIIPVYNAEKYLSVCLNSIRNQTHEDLEIICVNDGSVDRSMSILNAFAEKDKRIQVVSQENAGQSAARNHGLDLATGEYVFFLDSDDFVHPQTLETALYFAKKDNSKLVTFLFEKEENPGELKARGYEKYEIEKIPSLVRHNMLPYTNPKARPFLEWVVTTTLFKKDIFDQFRFKEGMYYEDTLLLMSVLRDNPPTTIVPIPFYKYRINPNSTTNVVFSKKHLHSYHTLLSELHDYYNKDEKYQDKWNFLVDILIRPVCEKAVSQILQTPMENQVALYPEMVKMLDEMDEYGCLPKKGIGSKRQLLTRLKKVKNAAEPFLGQDKEPKKEKNTAIKCGRVVNKFYQKKAFTRNINRD